MQFIKKQETVEAEQWKGTQDSLAAVKQIACGAVARFEKMRPPLNVNTLKGPQRAEIGDWIVKDITGNVQVWDDARFNRAFGTPQQAERGLTQETVAELLAEQMQAVKGLLLSEDKVRAIAKEVVIASRPGRKAKNG